MSLTRFYRFVIWLPVMVPAVLIVVMNALIRGVDMPRPLGFALGIVASSLLFGGLPYIALASWATWWVKDRDEMQIVRLMYFAPILMVAAFAVSCFMMGLFVGLDVWMRIAAFGTIVILLLGYGYVGLTILLRLFARRLIA